MKSFDWAPLIAYLEKSIEVNDPAPVIRLRELLARYDPIVNLRQLMRRFQSFQKQLASERQITSSRDYSILRYLCRCYGVRRVEELLTKFIGIESLGTRPVGMDAFRKFCGRHGSFTEVQKFNVKFSDGNFPE